MLNGGLVVAGEAMEIFLSIIHVVLCLFMILVILLQPGREGGGMGGALGGGAATSAFGGQGATTFLSKLTAGCAVTFFITSLLLSFIGYQGSVVAGQKAPPPAASSTSETQAPAAELPGAEANIEAEPMEPAAEVEAGIELPAVESPSSAEQVPAL